MPIYPPRNAAIRKAEILDYKIFEYVQALNKSTSLERMKNLSEKVRIAKLNHLKAELHVRTPYSGEDEKRGNFKVREKLNNEIEKWNSMTFDDIEKYCRNH